MARFTRPTKTLMAVVLLSLAAIWATLNSPTIFFDQQIILGSSLGVFALLQFGWLGLPVGMASAFCTVAMWGHPWAALVMLLQLLWQQFFLSRFNGGTGERGNGRIVLATIIFWLLVGLPLKGTSEKPAKLASSPSLRLAGERSATAGVQRLRTGLRQEEDAAADLPRRDGSHHPLG
ncbi:MAG: hypothetical protein ACNA8O_01645 [Cyanobacteriota bacterium]